MKSNPAVSTKKRLIPLLAILIPAIAAVALLNPFSRSFSDDPKAIEAAAESVVKLSMYDANDICIGTGSGFAAFDDGIIVTNYHCIESGVYSIDAQRGDGSVFPIDSVVAYDKEADIAILRAPDSGLTPLKVGVGLDTKQGETVSAIGSPDGIAGMYSIGVLSKLEYMGDFTVLLSTASISPGSSGGALFNDRGEVIGITSAERIDANDIYLSVPIEYAKALYDSYTPETEMTLADWYAQSEHLCTVDYLLAYGDLLHDKTVTTYGYIAGMDADIYLVPTSDLVANVDVRTDYDLTAAVKLRELRSNRQAVQIILSKNHLSADDLRPGDRITVEGTVMYDPDSGVRLIADAIEKS